MKIIKILFFYFRIRPIFTLATKNKGWYKDTDKKIIKIEAKKFKENSMFMIQSLFVQKEDITEEFLKDISSVSENIPFLLISGRHDQMSPIEQANKLEQHLKNKEHVVIENTAHMIMIEQPKKTLEHICSFCDLKIGF